MFVHWPTTSELFLNWWKAKYLLGKLTNCFISKRICKWTVCALADCSRIELVMQLTTGLLPKFLIKKYIIYGTNNDMISCLLFWQLNGCFKTRSENYIANWKIAEYNFVLPHCLFTGWFVGWYQINAHCTQ